MKDFDIPKGLSDQARKAAEAIVATAGEGASGGGCRAFWTPAEWAARGEKYGLGAILIVVHDGGDLAPFFCAGYLAYEAMNTMEQELEKIGCRAEQCTGWYTAIYAQ